MTAIKREVHVSKSYQEQCHGLEHVTKLFSTATIDDDVIHTGLWSLNHTSRDKMFEGYMIWLHKHLILFFSLNCLTLKELSSLHMKNAHKSAQNSTY